MNRVLEIYAFNSVASVQPGIVLDALQSQVLKHGLMFAPDPSTHSRCTIGGLVGNNSCGTHSLRGGKTVDNCEELRVLLYAGTQLSIGAKSDAGLAHILDKSGAA